MIRVGVGVWFLVMTATALAQQQTGSIRGVIYDKDFDAPLALAQVTVSETAQKITATEQGNYVIEGVLPGTYTLVFSKDGYVRQVKSNVVVQPGQLTDVDAQLSGQFEDMEEFVVQDVRIGSGKEADLLILREKNPAFTDLIGLETISKSGAGNVADILKLIPGTSVQDGKFAVVRGLPDRYVNSQLNGVRLPSADDKTRAVELDQYPSSVVESIQVSKTFTPDQQGDASGGAVNVVLRGIPDENILQFSSSVGYNSQTPGRGKFLTYKGGGVSFLGLDDGGRDKQPEFDFPDANHDDIPDGSDGLYDGAVGVSRGDAPIDYKWSLSAGGKHEFEDGAKIGGLANFFYERDSSYYENGIDDEYWVTSPGGSIRPVEKGDPFSEDGAPKTSLFDVTQGSQEVKWGGLGVAGIEWAEQQLKVSYLYTRTTEDTAVLSEDTRGNAYYFPNTAGTYFSTLAVPYLRAESLVYNERSTQSLQFNGRHKLPLFESAESDTWIAPLDPEVDWTYSLNKADYIEPDKRLFSTLWIAPFPGDEPGYHYFYRPANTSEQGNLYHIFRSISEESQQYQLNLKLPFRQWTETEGYVKFGLFADHVKRSYEQETFQNSGDTNVEYRADWEQLWSEVWPNQVHYIEPAFTDIDYTGEFDVEAWYWMVDLPLIPNFKLIGGIRYESTRIKTEVAPETDPSGQGATYYPPLPAAATPIEVDPSAVNVSYQQQDILPSVGFAWDVIENLTLRGTYAQTVARQTFRELTPIAQQEYFGGDVFVGNPDLQMSALKNYDLRLDYKPTPGSLYSISYFYKSIDKPIEYIQRVASFSSFITPINYPKGTLSGFELETRQDLGELWEDLSGLSIGGNATIIESEVIVSQYEIDAFNSFGYTPITKRDATNAPAYLYNIFSTYNVESIGTEFAIFYTVRGDTLVAGAGVDAGAFIPSVYETEYGTLNFGITQKIGEHIKLKFQAKNLLDPEIKTVYRYNGQDTVKSSYTKGIDFSFGISAEFKF